MLVYFGLAVVLVVLSSVLEPGLVLRALIILLVAVIILYEPVLVAWAGGTVGHRSLGLRVVRTGTGRRVSFPRAFLRFAVKAVTGLPGFIAIELTRKHQGLHDLVAGTVVTPRELASPSLETFAVERVLPDPRTLPPVGQRIAVIVGYLVAAFVAISFASALMYSDQCLDLNVCTGTERLFEVVAGLVFLVLIVAIVSGGWTGRLPGARRRPAASQAAAPGEGEPPT